ncbi:MAG: O-antigen ligase family protein [Phycisphaerae bacterium]|nr:O-antigen ligase family protein [Phycisphaerae bacterium]
MPLRSIAFLLSFIGSSTAAFVVPVLGVLFYVALYHLYPESAWWGKPLRPLGIRYSFVCGLCLLIGTALNLNRLRFGQRFFHPVEWLLLALFGCMFLSAAILPEWNARTEEHMDKMSKVFLFTFLMSHVLVSRNQLWQFAVLLTAVSLYLGHEAKTAPPGAFTGSRLDGIGGPDFQESAGLAIHLFALLPFVAVVFKARKLWLKGLAFLAACYSMNAILLCRARSAFLAAIVGGLMALWYIPRRHRRWVVVVLLLGTAGGIILSDNWFWERMVTIFSSAEERDASAASRLIIWQGALKMVREYPWGVGVGRFRDMIGRYIDDPSFAYRDAHNSFVICATEIGVPGLLAYTAVLTASWITLSRLAQRVPRTVVNGDLFEMLIFANRLALIVYVVSGFFVSRFYVEGFWWFVALPVCLQRAVENEIRVEREEAFVLQARLNMEMNPAPGWLMPPHVPAPAR